jgi:hypothetical protein
VATAQPRPSDVAEAESPEYLQGSGAGEERRFRHVRGSEDEGAQRLCVCLHQVLSNLLVEEPCYTFLTKQRFRGLHLLAIRKHRYQKECLKIRYVPTAGVLRNAGYRYCHTQFTIHRRNFVVCYSRATESRGRVANIPASNSGGPAFESEPETGYPD